MPLGDPSLAAQVFGRRLDPWTNRATDLLERVKLPYHFVDLDLDVPDSDKLRAQLIHETRHYETPYVFLHGRFIGGFAELDEHERLGQLTAAPPRPGRTEVVIVARPQEFRPPALWDRRPAPGDDDEGDEEDGA